MNDKPIPILAYGLIGITTLVISYATFLDSKAEKGATTTQSSTTMLPNIGSMNPFATQPAANTSVLPNIGAMNPMAQAPGQVPGQAPVPPAPKFGGRSKRNRNKPKHKKTRSKI